MSWNSSKRGRPLALDGEHWLPVHGWPEYEVSNLGRVARRTPAPGATVGRILVQHDGGGRERNYMRVSLCRDGKCKKVLVHVVVAQTWIGVPPENGVKWVVHHLDADTHHNDQENLEWTSQRRNCAYSSRWPKNDDIHDDDLPF